MLCISFYYSINTNCMRDLIDLIWGAINLHLLKQFVLLNFYFSENYTSILKIQIGKPGISHTTKTVYC